MSTYPAHEDDAATDLVVILPRPIFDALSDLAAEAQIEMAALAASIIECVVLDDCAAHQDPFTPGDDRTIRTMRKLGNTPREIARTLNKDPALVRERMREMGVR